VKQHQAAEEDLLAPDQVAEAPGQEQEAAERQQIGVDDPRQVGLAEAEIVLDGGERDVHDRRVHGDHQLAQTHDKDGDPAPPRSRDGIRPPPP
jgi:hypothetical protein